MADTDIRLSPDMQSHVRESCHVRVTGTCTRAILDGAALASIRKRRQTEIQGTIQ